MFTSGFLPWLKDVARFSSLLQIKGQLKGPTMNPVLSSIVMNLPRRSWLTKKSPYSFGNWQRDGVRFAHFLWNFILTDRQGGRIKICTPNAKHPGEMCWVVSWHSLQGRHKMVKGNNHRRCKRPFLSVCINYGTTCMNYFRGDCLVQGWEVWSLV